MPRRKDGISCTAKAKSTQKRCGNPPMRGGTVCKFHGGAAPQVIAASARRILNDLVGPALVQLQKVLDDVSTPPAVRLAAVRDILDRTGLKPPIQIEVIARETLEAEYERLLAEAAND